MSKYIKYFLWIIRLIYFIIVRTLSRVVPKKNGLWLFGSWGGMRYSSSTKYMFQFTNSSCDDVSAYWITKNRTVYDKVRSYGLPVLYAYSFKGIWYSLRAEAIFVSNEIFDINPGFADGAVFVQLFHFALPIKNMMSGESKVDYETFKRYHFLKKFRLFLTYPHMFRNSDYYVCASKWMATEVTNARLRVDPEKILITGFPRSDAILQKHFTNKDILYFKNVIPESVYNEDLKIIYYLPTHRDHSPEFDPFSFGFDFNELTLILEKANAVLIFRFHPRDKIRINRSYEVNDRIIREPKGVEDPYLLLRRADVLIADYSSIFSDFLLLNRPIIFAKFDHDDYVKNRGLNWDYDHIAPGFKAENWQEVINALSNILLDKQDIFSEQRKELKNKIYNHFDTNNSKRLYLKMKQILET